MKLTKVEFNECDILDEAYEVYSDSSFVFYEHNNQYYVADNGETEPYYIGCGIESIEEFLMSFAF